MTSAPPVRIVPLDTLPQPGRLAIVAEAVFGAGDRPEGWFARKLRRECVDTSLSPVAIDPAVDADDVRGWLGYVLVGTPPSLGDAVRTAGTGVIEAARGRGIGGALLARASYLAAAAGYGELQLLSAPERVSFYERHGLCVAQERVTLVRPSSGPREQTLPGPGPWNGPWNGPSNGPSNGAAPVEPAHVLVQWLPEAWAHTESSRRHTIALPDGFAHVSFEGRALLVHRCVAAGDPVATMQSLLAALPGGRAVMLPLTDRVSTITRALLEHGWHPIQAATLLRRRLSAPGSTTNRHR